MAEENKLNQTPEITPAPSAEAPEKAPTTGTTTRKRTIGAPVITAPAAASR